MIVEIVTTRLDVAPEAIGASYAVLSNAEQQRAQRMPSGRGRG